MPPASKNLHHHPSTRALHADDKLNQVVDVAPPIHLTTTFRFPEDPNKLIPSKDPVVRVFIENTRENLMGQITSMAGNSHPT